MKRLTDVEIHNLKALYVADTVSTKTELCDRLARKFGCGAPTIKRLAKAGDWDALRRGSLEVQKDAIAQAKPAEVMVLGETVVDVDGMLANSIHLLYERSQSADVKSMEGAMTALSRLLDAYAKRHPQTMDELVDAALAIPGFNPIEFAKKLRERFEG